MTNNNPSSIAQPAQRRSRGGARAIPILILLLGLIAAGGLFVWAEMQRREVQSQLESTARELEEIRHSTESSGQEAAQRVLDSVRRHIDVPAEPEPTVATIIDINRLRETNEFYNAAENGDHLIITEKRAILYDADRDIILDVVPVRITPPEESPSGQEDTPPPAGQ